MTPSEAMIELENLYGAACHHLQLCGEADCRTSVWLLRATAKRLAARVELHERQEAERLLAEWPK